MAKRGWARRQTRNDPVYTFDDPDRIAYIEANAVAIVREDHRVITEQARRITNLEERETNHRFAMQRVRNILNEYGWLAEGRGPHAYDDSGYDDDVRAAFAALIDATDPHINHEPYRSLLKRSARMDRAIRNIALANEEWSNVEAWAGEELEWLQSRIEEAYKLTWEAGDPAHAREPKLKGPPAPCPEVLDVGGFPRQYCALGAGHPEQHASADGTRWRAL